MLICESFHLLSVKVKKKYDNRAVMSFSADFNSLVYVHMIPAKLSNLLKISSVLKITQEEIEALIKKHVGYIKSDIDDLKPVGTALYHQGKNQYGSIILSCIYNRKRSDEVIQLTDI